MNLRLWDATDWIDDNAFRAVPSALLSPVYKTYALLLAELLSLQLLC